MQHYDNLINMLLENQITPIVTLYHWDLPQVSIRGRFGDYFFILCGGNVHYVGIERMMFSHRALIRFAPCVILSIRKPHVCFQVLQEKYGGWQNSSMIGFFNDYANLCFERFGNRVKHWITFNNPWVSLTNVIPQDSSSR